MTHYDFQGQAIQFRLQMEQPIGKHIANLRLQRELIRIHLQSGMRSVNYPRLFRLFWIQIHNIWRYFLRMSPTISFLL